MKAVISSDFNDIYLFNIPIVAWAWKKLDVDLIWFQKSPTPDTFKTYNESNLAIRKLALISYITLLQKCHPQRHFFDCPLEKAATYAQVSRLFACCLNLPEEEILITSDADMMVFKLPPIHTNGLLTIFGDDLTPPKQYPMCYASASVYIWRTMLPENSLTYQECLDAELGVIEAEHFRGNFWSRDQELLFNGAKEIGCFTKPRARPGTQFAEHRLDRDDAYILDRLSPDIIDYHMHRPLWGEDNFQKLLTIMQYFWPNEDFKWITDYRNEYMKLL